MKKICLAAISAAVLTACGGGGNDGETKASVASIKVVGASLADSGTFGGRRFTVQPTGTATPYPVYVERIAANYQVPLCPAYSSADTMTYTAKAGCTNHAVGGARINYTVGAAKVETLPLSAIKQLVDAGAAGYGANDLLIVGEAGANDAATLVAAFISATTAQTADFQTLLLTLVDPAAVQANAANPPVLGQLYMQALADKLTSAVKVNALDKGATRVVMLNTLDITKTPRFQGALKQIAAATTPETAAQIQGLGQLWIQSFNARLASNVAALGSQVVVVDFHKAFNDEMADPAQYGLSNVTASVCDQALNGGAAPAVTSFSTPAVIATCTDSAAAAVVPTESADGTNGWWKKYLFADNFHPTPYGHQLLGQLVAKRLSEAGWL